MSKWLHASAARQPQAASWLALREASSMQAKAVWHTTDMRHKII